MKRFKRQPTAIELLNMSDELQEGAGFQTRRFLSKHGEFVTRHWTGGSHDAPGDSDQCESVAPEILAIFAKIGEAAAALSVADRMIRDLAIERLNVVVHGAAITIHKSRAHSATLGNGTQIGPLPTEIDLVRALAAHGVDLRKCDYDTRSDCRTIVTEWWYR